MADVSSTKIFAIADSLGFDVKLNHDNLSLAGEAIRAININGSKIEFPIKIVSSRLTGAAYMVICRLIGNLAIFVGVKASSGSSVRRLYVLNLARMDAPNGWLEKHRPEGLAEARTELGKAVMRVFEAPVGADKWTEVKD